MANSDKDDNIPTYDFDGNSVEGTEQDTDPNVFKFTFDLGPDQMPRINLEELERPVSIDAIEIISLDDEVDKIDIQEELTFAAQLANVLSMNHDVLDQVITLDCGKHKNVSDNIFALVIDPKDGSMPKLALNSRLFQIEEFVDKFKGQILKTLELDENLRVNELIEREDVKEYFKVQKKECNCT